MPTIVINRADFCRLIDKELSTEQLAEQLPMMGVGVERAEGEELEVEITPNRPDMLCTEGLARAFSAWAGIDTGLPEYVALESEYKIHVDRSVLEIRPVIVAAVVKGLQLTEQLLRSLLQLQEKLHATYCRRRAKASIGIYDLDKLQFPIRYTTAEPGFKFAALDFELPATLADILARHPKGQEHGWIIRHHKRYPILTDARHTVLSMPPIINSSQTAITTNTKNLFIDVTGTDSKTAAEILVIITTALAERGGKIYSVTIEYPDRAINTPDFSPRIMNLSLDYANKLLGLKLSINHVIELLGRMRLGAIEFLDAREPVIEVTIPAYRTDIMHPIDIIEDIAIAYGYSKLEPELPALFTIGEENELELLSRKLANLMVGLGFQEVLTYILSNSDKLSARMAMSEQPLVRTVNPRTTEFTAARSWLLPSLLEVLSANQHNPFPQRLFELGECIMLEPAAETGAAQSRKLAAVVCHDAANLTECKSIVESILNNLGLSFEIRPVEHPSFIPTRVGEIVISGKRAGFFGELHPAVLKAWGLERPVIGFELDIEKLMCQPAR